MPSENPDVERAVVSATVEPNKPTTKNHRPPRHSHASLELETFQVLLGIRTPDEISGDLGSKPHHTTTKAKRTPTEIADDTSYHSRPKLSLRQIFLPPRTCRNIGLYPRAINEEWKNRIAYLLTSITINMLYLLQILLAATFTALSAYQESSSVTLTVLGAINTVLAGVLAFLKGQGMPNRFRKARDEYANLVRAIEETERLFAEVGGMVEGTGQRLDPRRERDRLQGMFDDARREQQANYPDLYVSTNGRAEAGGRREDFGAGMMEKYGEMMGRIEGLERGLGGRGKGKEKVLNE